MSGSGSLSSWHQGPLLAGSSRSLRDHKAAVRHSGRVARTLHSVSETRFRLDLLPPITGAADSLFGTQIQAVPAG